LLVFYDSNCKVCGKTILISKFSRFKLCRNCNKQRRECLKIKKIELSKNELITNEYSLYIFDLYLNYTNRYKYKSAILKQANNLLGYLSLTPIKTLKNWKEIYAESDKYCASYKENKKVTGCPFIKIGRMLTEIGVITSRYEDRSHYFGKLLKRFSSNLTAITEINIQAYLIHLKDKGHNQVYCHLTFTHLSIFFRWCKAEKIILVNPCNKLQSSRPLQQITVCDEDTVNQLMRFVKNPKSCPEQAMIILLILVWGFRSEDLGHAKIEITNNEFRIVLRRKSLKNIKYYNRKQIITFPSKPNSWIYLLQQRFYKEWLIQYQDRIKSFPCYYLFLPRYRAIRPLTNETIVARIYEATEAAVGKRITSRILRQTCGAIHSTASDASILATLGWSSDYCFNYTWVPKVYLK